MRRYERAGVAVTEVLLPRAGTDLAKWAVVACDQYTSEPEYWASVDAAVGDAPSTLRLIYPEVYLGEADREGRIRRIREAMSGYLAQGLLEPHDGMVYVERTTGGRVRRGLVLAIDLEAYDYSKGSTSPVRATEGTIVERIPPRVAIRKGAPLESPHIMVLIDDPEDSVLGPVAAARDDLKRLYDLELMKGGGHLSGWLVSDLGLEARTVGTLEALGEPESFARRYGLGPEVPVLLYAMGDGNHSLATAKAIWEETKRAASNPSEVMDAPTRYALVEIVNVHDPALEFEPIHRVLFDLERDPGDALRARLGDRLRIESAPDLETMARRVDAGRAGAHLWGLVTAEGCSVVEVARPEANLPVGTLQGLIDDLLASGVAREVDYVHGTATVASLGAQPGNAGLYLPAMGKDELFRTVILEGALPRKTFSMGEAQEKRFYMECRRLG